MEAKCGYCELMGKKPHCHNCKIMNLESPRLPQPMDCSIEELVEAFKTDDGMMNFIIGDWIDVELYTGQKVRITYIDSHKDVLEGGTTARGTFLISGIYGRYQKSAVNSNLLVNCDIRNKFVPAFFKLLPQCLQDNIKPAIKPVAENGSPTLFTDKLWLLSEVEYFGYNQYSYDGEGSQYEYFTKGANTRQFGEYVYTRSPYRSGRNYVCVVGRDGDYNYNDANSVYGVCLGFCL